MCWPFKKKERRHPHRRPDISLIVPFKGDDAERERNWHWLRRFYNYNLPEAEIIIGEDEGIPFSKAEAVNQAARHARGRILVIIDADAFIDPKVIKDCAQRILEAEESDFRLWFVPYRNLYRLTEESTEQIITDYSPHQEYFPTSPPPEDWIQTSTKTSAGYGHRYGAMIMILSREAFDLTRGFDPRFRGWGGEDASFMRAVDTLYAPHEVTQNDILHLWHPHTEGQNRRWEGQERLSINIRLTQRYSQASNDPTLMQAIIEELEQE